MLAGKKNLIIAAAVVATLIIIGFVVVATMFSWWPVVVDITLCVAALASLILLSALIYAVFSLTRTALRIRDELMPMLNRSRPPPRPCARPRVPPARLVCSQPCAPPAPCWALARSPR